MSPDRIYVVELDNGQALLGTLSSTEDGRLKVRTGFRGHPTVVSQEEVSVIVLADLHPDVLQER